MVCILYMYIFHFAGDPRQNTDSEGEVTPRLSLESRDSLENSSSAPDLTFPFLHRKAVESSTSTKGQGLPAVLEPFNVSQSLTSAK